MVSKCSLVEFSHQLHKIGILTYPTYTDKETEVTEAKQLAQGQSAAPTCALRTTLYCLPGNEGNMGGPEQVARAEGGSCDGLSCHGQQLTPS